MAKYLAATIPCCQLCDNRDETKVCKKCAVVYCRHFASTTDLRFCANCISDFHIKETIMEKLVEHEKADGTVTFSRKYQARHIQLQGTDWLFAAGLIEHLSDSEIEETIEYHKANVSLMLMERDSRKLERFRKMSGVKVSPSNGISQEAKEKKIAAASKASSNTNKATTKKQQTMNANLAALLATAGYTPEQVALIMSGGKI